MSGAVEKIDKILNIVTKMSKKVDFLESKIEEALYEDGDDFEEEEVQPEYKETAPVPEQDNSAGDLLTEEEIKKFGTKIPYLKYTGAGADGLREFIYYIRSNPEAFSRNELTTATYIDKNFDDLHISENSFRILNQAYKKTHQSRIIPWKHITGFLYKYGYHKIWEWNE